MRFIHDNYCELCFCDNITRHLLNHKSLASLPSIGVVRIELSMLLIWYTYWSHPINTWDIHYTTWENNANMTQSKLLKIQKLKLPMTADCSSLNVYITFHWPVSSLYKDKGYFITFGFHLNSHIQVLSLLGNKIYIVNYLMYIIIINERGLGFLYTQVNTSLSNNYK